MAVACNAIWGIDAPTLGSADGGVGDGHPADVVASDVRGRDAKRDAPPPDAPSDAPADATGDAARDATRDASPDALPDVTKDSMPSDAPEIFDGHCVCEGGPCPPIVVASGQAGPELIVTDNNGVYWTTNGTLAPTSGTVVAATFDGKVTPLALAQSNPRGIALASGNLAWAQASLGAIELCALPACKSPVTITMSTPGLGLLALDSTTIYFEALSAIDTCSISGCGGSPMKVAALAGQGGIAMDGTSVYWADQTAGTIQSCPIAGFCAPVLLTNGESSPTGLVVGSGHLYWTDSAGEIRACSVANCNTDKMSLVAAGIYTPLHLAVDGVSVYWTDMGGRIAKVAVSGGSPVNLESSEPSPGGIAVGASCVFWTDSPTGADAGDIRATAK
jgi:hypothetical protein